LKNSCIFHTLDLISSIIYTYIYFTFILLKFNFQSPEFHEDQNGINNNNRDEHHQLEQTVATHLSSENISLQVTTFNEMLTLENTDSPEIIEILSDIPDGK
jgi:hypothetical protein